MTLPLEQTAAGWDSGAEHYADAFAPFTGAFAADAIELARQNARRAAEADDDLAATGTDDFRAVAPAAQSFASGRRR